MGRINKAHYPEGSRPRPISSFELPKTSFSERLKLAVVIQEDFEDDLLVWSAINRKAEGRLDVVVNVLHPQDAAARWGHWHWMPVRCYGTAEEDEFFEEADKVIIVGDRNNELLIYYRDLAKYYNKPVAWASPKEASE